MGEPIPMTIQVLFFVLYTVMRVIGLPFLFV